MKVGSTSKNGFTRSFPRGTITRGGSRSLSKLGSRGSQPEFRAKSFWFWRENSRDASHERLKFLQVSGQTKTTKEPPTHTSATLRCYLVLIRLPSRMGISTIALVGASTTGVLMRLPERFFVSGLPVVFWLSKRPNLCARWACYPPIPSINIHLHPYQAYPLHPPTPLVPPVSTMTHQLWLSWRVSSTCNGATTYDHGAKFIRFRAYLLPIAIVFHYNRDHHHQHSIPRLHMLCNNEFYRYVRCWADRIRCAAILPPNLRKSRYQCAWFHFTR